jgi:hypothetical protein
MHALNRNQMITTIEDILGELCSADLTLGRSKALRAQLFEALEALGPVDDATSRAGAGVGLVESDHAIAATSSARRERLHPGRTRFPDLLQGTCVG